MPPFSLSHFLLCLPFAARAQEPVTGNSFAHDPGTMIKEGSRYYVFPAGPDALALQVNLDSTNNGPTLTLNWPAYAVGFIPQATTNLGGAWTPLSLPTLPANDRWQITLPTTNDARFFRLKR